VKISKPKKISATSLEAPDRPLSALLSQILVAFTIEFDNALEQRMGAAGYPGTNLSLVVWSNLMRFVPSHGIPVSELADQALIPVKGIQFLGCLERWGVVVRLVLYYFAARASAGNFPRKHHFNSWLMSVISIPGITINLQDSISRGSSSSGSWQVTRQYWQS
jgi:hypothetical protein